MRCKPTADCVIAEATGDPEEDTQASILLASWAACGRKDFVGVDQGFWRKVGEGRLLEGMEGCYKVMAS